MNYEKTSVNRQTKIIYGNKIDLIYKTKVDSLRNLNQWNSKAVEDIYNKLPKEKNTIKRNSLFKKLQKIRDNKKDLTPQARIYQNKIDFIVNKIRESERKLIKSDTSLLGFSMLMDNLYSNKYNTDFNYFATVESLEKFQKKFKNHPYTKESKQIFKGIINSKIGGDYNDFSSRAKDGKIVLASPIIEKNIVTLIDLWAPWCGPCIAKSKKLKPEYKKLKNKGLEVFAVIGGIKNKEKYIKTRDKYKYPWQVNYELNEEFNIWAKYNISNSGGSQFLVNSQGKILAINPEPKEIDSILVSLKSIKL